ncbi:MAG: PfkB family carbohydrate kinase [Candidatus Dormiibacterota bacterium]
MAYVYVVGTVFLDLILTGLEGPPPPGTEAYASGMAVSPGGVATVAVALARLGVQVELAALFADDIWADLLWRTLSDEGVDLGASRRILGWSTPLTVSLAFAQDRSLATYNATPPAKLDVGEGLSARVRACFTHLAPEISADWLDRARSLAIPVFADSRWDTTQIWPAEVLQPLRPEDTFLPNAVEAMRYTRTQSPREALARISELVAVAVVKCGADGAIASLRGGPILQETGLEVDAVDTTGAGDVFDAAFIYASLQNWTLEQRLRFAVLCSGLSVARRGGALSAPTWSEIRAFMAKARESDIAGRWTFLGQVAAQSQSVGG